MDNFLRMLSTQAIMFTYMCVGWYCSKRDIIDRKTQSRLTDFVLRITLPCMIFNSFQINLTMELLKQASQCLVAAFLICFLAWIAGKWIYNMYPAERRCILRYATLVNNSGFLGLPIVSAVLGEEGLLLAAIFIIPNRIFMWTAGMAMFTDSSDGKSVFKKVMLNPCIIAVFLGIFRSVVNLPLPEFATKALSGLGSATTPLSMVLIGTMMTALTFQSFKDLSTVYLGVVRLLILPLVSLVLLRLMGADATLTACGVILTAMPAGSTTALLADKYGADAVYGTKCTVTNTLFSIATIPLITLLV
ncbi:MAG: AEC family transporter [Lachnospiraceae bacterium]|nr:AEC family transporter [Lachnospiraceae bacterium]NBJ81009.1 AEC family transporter [bacterium 1XD42-76]NBK04218.1 AEC family transporter [bacterium 1XD42-94]